MKASEPRKGTVLISYPSTNSGDTIFSRSVILITEFNKEGAVGFILNKPLNIRISDLIPYINMDFRIYKGGPVETDKVFFIHNVPHLIQDSTPITEDLFWGGDFEDLVRVLNDGLINENNVTFFLGYSGWDCDQLNNEIEDEYWIVDNRKFQAKIFNQLQTELWRNHLLELGEEYAIWANAAESPELN
ncbi:YqgE/AlgH family protein [Flavobacterium sp. HSC-61S13]|uniref:YqgE/AlgH family protein n=1 Tax=Flavobacterium sp. HSC-61S13 TaxID=2910963 RepID=UPI0020A09020|nr:YqgE/AlgH family protein [Flavobacterium sp. HSC-61S13]MCP1995640.1 putative transcriptional regulator [Flavobacterium sp. HSC-61S13]